MNIKCFLLIPTDLPYREFVHPGGSKSYAPVYKRSDNGELVTLRDAPVGAIWRATWLEDCDIYCGPDGHSYYCRTPGGDWGIDMQASNCTLPDDTVHKCWCRHGEAPFFTVNKNGNTCTAGAGSIAIGAYHGFLINGELTDC